MSECQRLAQTNGLHWAGWDSSRTRCDFISTHAAEQHLQTAPREGNTLTSMGNTSGDMEPYRQREMSEKRAEEEKQRLQARLLRALIEP